MNPITEFIRRCSTPALKEREPFIRLSNVYVMRHIRSNDKKQIKEVKVEWFRAPNTEKAYLVKNKDGSYTVSNSGAKTTTVTSIETLKGPITVLEESSSYGFYRNILKWYKDRTVHFMGSESRRINSNQPDPNFYSYEIRDTRGLESAKITNDLGICYPIAHKWNKALYYSPSTGKYEFNAGVYTREEALDKFKMKRVEAFGLGYDPRSMSFTKVDTSNINLFNALVFHKTDSNDDLKAFLKIATAAAYAP